ncbi:hypothetical protein ASPZODRAFT_164611 [Penicilliopsis zonata CBS 506.65]|uniref:RmlD-like substrate binding domain-containing protein n=1 Tax=Penicilliopsis zonata CBS 506.65 TaxID=1073090 RepID=A0A1L9SPL4_9EURO|nr:hypothetical protein ASPZODRAFT_164611 [Penicilliopsis zonata CBS 506.65]OJJ49033.1 hypothetical protein ASPZODRAFT_164611 [Penicilliopsis zonata CBS 506.65]
MSQVVLVTGASGLLGRQVFNTFKRSSCLVIGQGYSRATPPTILKADLEKPDEIEALVDEVKPSIIVHCAANRSPDSCDANPEQARQVNVEATRTLARAASTRGALLIYISTDYVFPGTEGQAPYEADAATNPPNTYGQFKRDGEVAVLEETRETGLGIVLRVPVLYGSAKSNAESAVNVLVDAVWKSQGEGEVVMDDWAIRYPTNTEDVARVCRDIVIKYLQNRTRMREMPHILQFSSEDRMTKYEICEKLAGVLGLPLTAMKRNSQGNDPNAAVQRPYDCHLSTRELQKLEIDVSTIDFVAWWRRELKAFKK